MDFLSARNLRMHTEYLENLRCRFSIFEKSYNGLAGGDLKSIARSHIPHTEKKAAISIKSEIILHEVYFSSFFESGSVSQNVKKKYGSEASFLYKLYDECLDKDGFLIVFLNKSNEPEYYAGREYCELLMSVVPCLSIDLCEHAYFYDFGFDKKRYLQSALSALDLLKLNKQ